ncbi:peroxisomal membrane protein 11C [Cylas formicarius]|uniref:peroxisomal membrane protein 11C n=1 Tax=Cylas formicarius TaxID=197179 RepID=UPI0029588349|nr:peroxisomal membrane protein 11C [Cylas formicarius]
MVFFWNDFLNESNQLLDTYKGRDKVLRTLCYLTKLLGDVQKNPDSAKKFAIFSSQMSATRSTLRLLDDLAVIKHTFQYGLGRDEPDKLMACLGVTTNILDQTFLVLEKISWLSKYQILTGFNRERWDNASACCWVLGTYLTIIKTLRYLVILETHKGCVAKDKRVPMEKFKVIKKFQLLTLARLLADFTHAVSTLPPGFLWSSRLKPWQVGVVGTFSSALGIYLIIYKRWLK